MKMDTFGVFLRYIVNSRNLSAQKLAEMTGNKSKTAILRLLNDQSSKKTILKFAEILIRTIELSKEEKECMSRILLGNDVSPSQRSAMNNLLTLFKKCDCKKNAGITCTAYNSEPTDNAVSFSELFKICLNRESLIIIEDVVSNELAFVLDKLIHESVGEKFSPVINHFFKQDEGIESKGKQLLSLMKLATYVKYRAYGVKYGYSMEKKIIILTFRRKAIHMRLVEFYDVNKFYFSDTEISETFYNHLLYRQKFLEEHSTLMHSEPICRDQLLDMLKVLSQYDLKESMQVNSTPTYMMIPFDIQCRLFEACNYIGLGKNDPYIQPLYNLLEEREQLFDESDISRKLIWTVDGIESFLKTGKTGDYFEPFEALTYDECKITLEKMINKKGIECRILKKQYLIFGMEFVVYDNCIIIYDTIWKNGEGRTMAMITDKRMIGLITDFYNKVFWEKCCYGEQESRKIIEELIEKNKR